MNDYTPTTQDVRQAYAQRYAEQVEYTSAGYAEFDRWFAFEIEKAERRGEVLATASRIASENAELLRRLS